MVECVWSSGGRQVRRQPLERSSLGRPRRQWRLRVALAHSADSRPLELWLSAAAVVVASEAGAIPDELNDHENRLLLSLAAATSGQLVSRRAGANRPMRDGRPNGSRR